VIFLFFSFFFLIINLFEIKWWYNTKLENIKWWKIVFVLDVSKSMNVLDIWGDNIKISRLNTSKWLIEEFIKNTDNTYWLIVFAWEALEMLPFTSDIWIFKTVLYWLSNNNISKYWTNLNSVFESLLSYFSSNNDWWLAVIFTDGWDEYIDTSSDLIESLNNKWVKIVLIWVWTKQWWKIPVWKDFFGKNIYKIYNNKIVISKLNNKELTNISTKYNIDYINISNKNDIKKVNDIITKNINKVNMEKNINFRVDYTRLFIFISFLFFLTYLITVNISWRKK